MGIIPTVHGSASNEYSSWWQYYSEAQWYLDDACTVEVNMLKARRCCEELEKFWVSGVDQ